MSIARRIFNCDLINYACALIIITIAVVYGRYFSKTSSFAPTTAFASIKRKMGSTISPKILGLRPLTAIPVGSATTLCHRGRRTLALDRKLYVGKRLTSSETGLNLTKLSGLAFKPHQLLFDTKSLDGFLLSVSNCPPTVIQLIILAALRKRVRDIYSVGGLFRVLEYHPELN